MDASSGYINVTMHFQQSWKNTACRKRLEGLAVFGQKQDALKPRYIKALRHFFKIFSAVFA
jgi:hypothetical protein